VSCTPQKRLSPIVLIAAWAAFLLAFIVLGPRRYGIVSWLFLAAAVLAGGLSMVRSHREAQRSGREWAAWHRRLRLLVDVNDVEDDGHLYEWFDPADWDRIFSALEEMPRGSRNLRLAITAVDLEVPGRD
jgi:hypothetical protein